MVTQVFLFQNSMIKINNLYKKYNSEIEVDALKNINLIIEDSKLTTIIGNSGSGKTTLFNMIGAIDRPTEGTVIVDDIDIFNLNEKELANYRNEHIGYIFQAFYLEESFTVLENIIMPLVIRGISKKEREEKALNIAKKMGIESKLMAKASKLSGGEKQRVAIARALINDPKIILADEPTGNLDSKNGDVIMDLLKELSNEGKTIVLITHNNEYANKYSDKIIHLKDGETYEN